MGWNRRWSQFNRKLKEMGKILVLEEHVKQLESALKQVERDYLDLADELDETRRSAENTENILKKNIRLWGLKEKVEGDNFVQYLQDLFTGCVGADCGLVISFNFAFGVGKYSEKVCYT